MKLRKAGSELHLYFPHRLFTNLQNRKCRGCSEKLKNEVFLCKSAPEARKIGGQFGQIMKNSPPCFSYGQKQGGEFFILIGLMGFWRLLKQKCSISGLRWSWRDFCGINNLENICLMHFQAFGGVAEPPPARSEGCVFFFGIMSTGEYHLMKSSDLDTKYSNTVNIVPAHRSP